MISSVYDMIVVTGPTASGKTRLAALIADRLGGEVISADSRQVYRGMDIGTGKDYLDYRVNDREIPFHLVDIVDAGYKYNVFEYQQDFLKVYNEMKSRDSLPVLCGGSGMYIDSIINGYRLIRVPVNQPLRERLEKLDLGELRRILEGYRKLHNTTDVDTVKRAVRAIEIEEYYSEKSVAGDDFPETRPLITAIRFDREKRRLRITERLKSRLADGMVDEVAALIDSGIPPDVLIYYGLEYKYITLYLTGVIGYEEMFRRLESAIHQFAKRQMTWFRGMERRGVAIHWIDGEIPESEKIEIVLALFRG